MHSSSSLALVTSARTCLLFYRHALNVGDTAAADAHRVYIENARSALAQYGLKFKIGYHHAQLIEYFLDRASNPTYEKLVAHYPEHPRPGALPLTPTSHLGGAILTALNIKRGYWKPTPLSHGVNATAPNITGPNGVEINVADTSPSSSTPGSTSSAPGLVHQGSTGSHSDSPSTGPASAGSNGLGLWGNGTSESPRIVQGVSPFPAMKYVDLSGARDLPDSPSVDSLFTAKVTSPEGEARLNRAPGVAYPYVSQ